MSVIIGPDRRKIVLIVLGVVVVVVLVAAAAGIGGEAVIETEVWEDSESIENAIHEEVENKISRGLLAEGQSFKVVAIEGTVREHGSPYHITYSAKIDPIPGGEG